MKRHRDEEFFKKNIAALYGDVYRFARAMTDDALSAEELFRLTMRNGEIALAVMKTLDEAHTGVYGDPAPHKVKIHMKKGPFIVVSGHDLKDLEMLLAQTQGKGIHV